MTAPSSLTSPTPATDAGATPPSGRRGRAWAWTGVAAGVLGIASMEASMRLGQGWEQTAGDPDAIVADLAGRVPTLLVFHTVTVLCALLVL
ncbi:hypothetical protein ACQUZK_09625, partial [Streptococcus pyogenes]|uniref:hypothetical protein n=1 Tax=Streptococcus pyogenes TaxID=1314 RepID=UPI003DA17F81